MDKLTSYDSSDSANESDEETKKTDGKNINEFSPHKTSTDFFNLDDTWNRDETIGDDNELCRKEIQMKNDGEKDIDLLLNSHVLSDKQFGPMLRKDTSVNYRSLRKRLSFPTSTFYIKRARCVSTDSDMDKLISDNKLSTSLSMQKDVSKELNISETSLQLLDTPVSYQEEIHPQIQKHLSKKIISKTSQKLFKKMTCHSGCVIQVEWCIPEYSHILLSASMDKTIKLWNMFSGKCIRTLQNHSSAVSCAKWRSDGIVILSGGYDAVAILTDANLGKVLSNYQHKHYVSSCAWHPSNSNLFITGTLAQILLWDKRAKETKPVKLYESSFGQVHDLVFLLEGDRFICSSDLVSRDSADRTIMAWDLRSTAILSNQIYHERYTCPALAVHPSGHWFVAQSNGNYIAEFSTVRPFKMNRNKRFEGHEVAGYRIGCDFSHDGKILASGSGDGLLYFYDFYSGSIIKSVRAFPNSPCISINYHPILNSTVATSSWTGEVAIWH